MKGRGMDAHTVMESYVLDVTRRLPRRERADVALELRALLGEELADREAQAGRPADAAMALDLLAAFGPPRQVALRYRPTDALIDPADTRGFLIAGVVGAVVLAALATLPAATPPSKDAVTTAILAWLGLLALVFAGRACALRRWPGLARWTPRDPDGANRFGSLALVAVIVAGLVAYGAPGWLAARFTADGLPPPWLTRLAYAPDFAATRLPWLLAAWAGQGLLYAWVAVEGRYRALTRRIDAALALAVSAALIWIFASGPMFATPAVDRTAHAWLAIITLGVLADAVLKASRLGRFTPRAGAAGAAA